MVVEAADDRGEELELHVQAGDGKWSGGAARSVRPRGRGGVRGACGWWQCDERERYGRSASSLASVPAFRVAHACPTAPAANQAWRRDGIGTSLEEEVPTDFSVYNRRPVVITRRCCYKPVYGVGLLRAVRSKSDWTIAQLSAR